MSELLQEIRQGFRTWIEIDTEAIQHNYRVFRSLIPSTTKLMSVVKSNAYGHGLVDFSKVVDEMGIDWFGVDSIVEGLRLRKEGIQKPILVLGYTLMERMQEAIDTSISVTVSSMYTMQLLKDLKLHNKIKVHVKVDSGMHRQGFLEQDIETCITFLKDNKNVFEVEGLYTHFASAKDPNIKEPTQRQVDVFMKWVNAFKAAGFRPIVHAGATGATFLYPDTHFDMCRVGIGFHGLWPSDESRAYLEKKLTLKPTLSWKTIISELKWLPIGERIGYDFTEETIRKTHMAVCPIGYWHGFPRALSGIGEVLVNGVKAKVMGRVSMDMIVIDVTDVPDVVVGNEVVLIGMSKTSYLGAHEIAQKIGMSVYEFITRINPLIKKIYR